MAVPTRISAQFGNSSTHRGGAAVRGTL